MKQWLLLLGLVWGAQGVRGQTAISPGHYGKLSPEAQVRWSNEETYRAAVRRDSGRLGQLLHNDYFRMGSNGASRKKAAVTRWASGAPPDGSRDAPARGRVRLPSPTTAVLTQDDVHITAAGDTVRATHKTDLWLKESGRWQLYASTSAREQLGPEARAIRAGSAGRNRAYAARDTAALAALLTPDFRMLTGAGKATGRAANVAGFQRLLARRPDLALVFTPETVEAASTTGSEAGTWIERWTEPDGPVELRGRYQVLWQLAAHEWRQQALLLVPTACTGGAYCR